MKTHHATLAAILMLGSSNILSQTQAVKVPQTTLVSRPVLLTGEVVANDSQYIFIPPANSSPVMIKNFVPEGSKVKAGDLLLRIETSSSDNLEQLESEIQKLDSKTKMDVAKLDVDALTTEKEFIVAKAALAKALVDASLPKTQISALDFDRYQGEKERAQRDLVVKQQAFDNAKLAVSRRQQDGELENKKQQIRLAFVKAQLAQSEVRARQDGIVTHAYNEWRGERFEEGSSGFPGNLAGQVMGMKALQIQAWALEADRSHLAEKQTVQLSFDALPGSIIDAQISHIASAPGPRASWGNGRYFKVDIALPAGLQLKLVPGMSVLIEPKKKASAPASPQGRIKTAHEKSLTDINIEGEVLSRLTSPIAPPTVRYIWKYTLSELAPEGSTIEPGQMLAVFRQRIFLSS